MFVDFDGNALKKTIGDILSNERFDAGDFERCFEVLQSFRNEGGTQDEALESLQSLRDSTNEVLDDRVLELMDVVVGWCHPKKRIW